MKYTLNSSSSAHENQDILPQTYSHKNIRKKERIRKIGFIRTWLREDILPFHVSQEDVRRGNADIKPLEFVPVSDGRKLRKEKRPPPPPAPIDFVRRLFRSDHWISNPMLLERRGRIFDHNSSTKRRNNSFFFSIHRKQSAGGKQGGNNSYLYTILIISSLPHKVELREKEMHLDFLEER